MPPPRRLPSLPASTLRPFAGLALLPALALLRAIPQATVLGLAPQCPFHAATGLLCPGCGATHAVLALVHGHPATAWHANPLLLLLLPLALLYAAVSLHRGCMPAPPSSVAATLLAITLVFTIWRNLA